MAASGKKAIIPKARAMYAKRIKLEEYENLMRRRTVPEVAEELKRHPYFTDSLTTLSSVDPHREQLEDLLRMDIYYKFRSLERYDTSPGGFARYFLISTEIDELLRAIQLLSVGGVGRYINHLPPFLTEYTRLDLLEMADAKSFAELLKSIRKTPYYHVLLPYCQKDPLVSDFPEVEAALKQYQYATVFDLIKKSFSGQEERSIYALFAQEAEVYNLDVIFRVRNFFPDLYPGEEIKKLLLPYRYHINRQKLHQMAEAASAEELIALYRQYDLARYDRDRTDIRQVDVTGQRVKYARARSILHLTSSPLAAMAALLSIAKMENENVITLIEGVRYRLPPERVRELLIY